MVTPTTFLLGAAQVGPSVFRSDARFASKATLADIVSHDDALVIDAPEPDSYAQGWAEGHAAALTQARGELARRTAADAAERDAMRLVMTRIDAALEARLAERLHDTVAALCAATLAPLALDADALAARTLRAAAMLARAEDARVVRLHPDDVALLADRLGDDLALRADPSLTRGAVRIEGAVGGVEDGPAQWHAAIVAALTEEEPTMASAQLTPNYLSVRPELVEGPLLSEVERQAPEQGQSFDKLRMDGVLG